jgi:hypothetical protein
MPKLTIAEVKDNFKTGAIPKGADFANLVDTLDDSQAIANETDARVQDVADLATAITSKADTSALAAKADTTTVNAALADKADVSALVALTASAPADIDTFAEAATRIQALEATTAGLKTGAFTNVTISSAAPAAQGVDGDVWIQYTP